MAYVDPTETLISVGSFYLDKIEGTNGIYYRLCYAEFNRGTFNDLESACKAFNALIKKNPKIRGL